MPIFIPLKQSFKRMNPRFFYPPEILKSVFLRRLVPLPPSRHQNRAGTRKSSKGGWLKKAVGEFGHGIFGVFLYYSL